MGQANQIRAGTMLTITAVRYLPGRDTALRRQTWRVAARPGMTVLEALFAIKEQHDGSLSFRCACRMGVCGSCGMVINGKPRLACNTQVSAIGTVIEVAPLPNHDVIKDLVPDLSETFEKHSGVKAHIIRGDKGEMESPTREYCQKPDELLRYVQFSYCLKCSMCLAACPTVATSKMFAGPQALAQAYRYNADSRDDGARERASALDAREGIFGCHLAGACSEACPKGVDPALGIQLLKRSMLVGPPSREPAVVVPAWPDGYRTPEAEGRPKAPPPSVST